MKCKEDEGGGWGGGGSEGGGRVVVGTVGALEGATHLADVIVKQREHFVHKVALHTYK